MTTANQGNNKKTKGTKQPMPELTATERVNIPAGTYKVQIMAIEEKISDTGPYLLWSFGMKSKKGPITINSVSSMNFGDKAKPRKWTEAILGRTLKTGEVINTDSLIGRECQILVTIVNKNGIEFNSVDSVLGMPTQNDAELPF